MDKYERIVEQFVFNVKSLTNFNEAVYKFKREYLLYNLGIFSNNKSLTARILGIPIKTIYNILGREIESVDNSNKMTCCKLCGMSEQTVLETHHIIPKSEGGTDCFDNLAILCANCHRKVHRKLTEIKTKSSM